MFPGVVLVTSFKDYPGVRVEADVSVLLFVSRDVPSCETRRGCKDEWMLRGMVKYKTLPSVVSLEKHGGHSFLDRTIRLVT
jgi:hypothetical protein